MASAIVVRENRTPPLALVALFASLAVTSAAAAEEKRPADKQACVSAYEEGQQLRKEGKLTAARARLLVCAQESCSPVLRKDCTVWVTEVEHATPTVTLSARGPSGKDVVDVAVALDGKPLTTHLDGKAIAIDPGPHTFRFELAGELPREETVLVKEGERNRSLVADFQPPGARSASLSASAVPTPMRAAPTPASVYVLGGVGVVGGGVFAAFGLMGLSAKHDLDKRGCRPNCAASDVDAVRKKLIIADVGLGVGAAALIAATVLYVTKGEVPSSTETAIRVDVSPTRDGAAFGLHGTF